MGFAGLFHHPIFGTKSFMDTRQAYNLWAQQYDTNENKTRDLEALALRQILSAFTFQYGLEIGCGTGKNTEWLCRKTEKLTAVDLSEAMLEKAKEKILAPHVQFLQADVTRPWPFEKSAYDLVSFSLVLEHIKDLDFIFHETAEALLPGGYVYIGELHPFKQYAGSKARFETEAGLQIVNCYNHHISDFVQPAKKHGLQLVDIHEFFDDSKKENLPRILVVLLRKTT